MYVVIRSFLFLTVPSTLSQDLERVHGERIQELLRERRRERDKENARQKETLKQMEDGLRARERIYRERIAGLEEQVKMHTRAST